MTNQTPPRWDLTNVYPALSSPEFAKDYAVLQERLAEMDKLLAQAESLTAQSPIEQLSQQLNTLIDRFNDLYVLAGTLRSYIHSFVSTDSFNAEAKRKQSELENQMVVLDKHEIRLRRWIGILRPVIPELLQQPGSAKEHAFFVQETADLSKYLMSQAEEDLAAELNLSGANAWAKLQGTVTSQLTWEVEVDGKLQRWPMPAIINLRSHPDETTRRRGYEAELAAWKTVSEPLAAALNGVKGAANTLNARRGYRDALHPALLINRIDSETLDAMLTAMSESLPNFRMYFHAKAKRLAKQALPWWDLFAPTGKTDRVYSFEEAREMILTNFARFSPDLSAYASKAFQGSWIDAEQRSGKRGGAFCMGVPGVKESRILLSFDGSLDTVSTLAHELGHGYHNECAYRFGRTEIQQNTPMTMAETASIMCETIMVDAALAQVQSADEELAILETSLIGDSQVVVDIYSRFLFEKEITERRAEAELSADDFCEIMSRAQKAAYGDGLDERYLQPYMWTWKPHYYFTGMPFYNFPYAFGLLFGTGLYAIYQQRGSAFVNDYQQLLAATGMGTAAELAGRFGIDIRSADFWRGSLEIINKRIQRYVSL